ncbi:MAG TPA: M35 family metallo-endopeptidase [Thermoanaerobaculia bacterium]|nr:M35 family metallo-endopeptidase [Thermoanaerobaculia bacterium]
MQRKCACGGASGADGECSECLEKRLQRKAASGGQLHAVPPIVHDVLRSSGQPLNHQTPSFMQSRFGHDFSRVRVQNDLKAEESTNSVNGLISTDNAEQADPGDSAEIKKCGEYTDQVKSRVMESRSAIIAAAADIRRINNLPEEDRIKEWNEGRYACWFGEFAKDALKNVVSIVTGIEDVSSNLAVECRKCLLQGRDVVAFSTPFDPKHVVKLCPLWFVDAEEQKHTLIHEMAHIAGADPSKQEEEDVYGSDEAKDLARRKPVDARLNADNYAFFVEDEKC